MAISAELKTEIMEKSGAVDLLAMKIVQPHTDYIMAAMARAPKSEKERLDVKDLYRFGMTAGICAGVRHGHTGKTADDCWSEFFEQGLEPRVAGRYITLNTLWHCRQAFVHGFGHGVEFYDNTQVSRAANDCFSCTTSDCQDCWEDDNDDE